MPTSRRIFLRNSALAVAGTIALPSSLTRAAFKSNATANKRLVVILQRGAADGLNMVVPHGDPAYYAMRPTIGVPRRSVIDLDGFFGFHPAMAPLHPLWAEKHLAIVHAAGSPQLMRSHIAAQDFMESGIPGMNSSDGWLNRALQAQPESTKGSSLRAIALSPAVPRILSGKESVLVLNPLKGNNTQDLTNVDAGKHAPARGAHYPPGTFACKLKKLASLIKANLGIQVAFADTGGWDHHMKQGGPQGQMAELLQDFSQSLAAFWVDLGDAAKDTLLVTMSEFGRSARENRNGGTDHGHGNVMLVLGGAVRGGEVYVRWPGLDQAQLHDGRDLAVTTDFRCVLAEAVSQHLGNPAVDQIFPGFARQSNEFLGLLA
jgi:uncharacterized protein (DUF1501 family)